MSYKILTMKTNNFKTVSILLFLTVFISCTAILKAHDIIAADLEDYELNENSQEIIHLTSLHIEDPEEIPVIISIPDIEDETDQIPTLEDFFAFPLKTLVITSYFGNRRINYSIQFHDGIDIATRVGTTVMAAMDGVVSVAVFHRQHGNYIVIKHSNGYKTLYSHLNSFSVKVGDTVSKGQKIGESGNTGNSTGPHLHFSIYDAEGNALDPLELLREQDTTPSFRNPPAE